MSVEYFPHSFADNFRFRDVLTNRAFCLSANGDEDRSCPERFLGSMAIAHYYFRSRSPSRVHFNLREHVLTIDHDSRMSPRPPFEKVLVAQRDVVSDIQAFGYNQDDPNQSKRTAKPALWCLLRQDLYLNDEPAAFLIVHWKHAFDAIDLVDVIPGDRTEWMGR